MFGLVHQTAADSVCIHKPAAFAEIRLEPSSDQGRENHPIDLELQYRSSFYQKCAATMLGWPDLPRITSVERTSSKFFCCQPLGATARILRNSSGIVRNSPAARVPKA